MPQLYSKAVVKLSRKITTRAFHMVPGTWAVDDCQVSSLPNMVESSDGSFDAAVSLHAHRKPGDRCGCPSFEKTIQAQRTCDLPKVT